MEEVLFAKKGASSRKIETPLVSIILPAFNESAIITNNVEEICFYMETSEYAGKWELIIVNDGSKDGTGKIADEISKNRKQVRVFHHPVNLSLGNALKTGFYHSRGKYVITLDIDLSYSVNHIQLLLDTITTTHSDVVLVSPYMKGGKTTAVPFFRRIMSRWVNWLMSLSSQEKYHTFTCMVRAYKGDFIRSLNLKTRDYEINPEIIYKSMILRAKIIEIPGHLDWTNQKKLGKRRVSGMKIYKGILSGLMSSFIFRPYIYYLAISTFVFSIFLYLITWIIINISSVYPQMSSGVYFDDRFSYAVKTVFEARPHAFLIAGIALLVSLQFLSMGFLSLQNKRYFEELFHISSAIKDKA